MRNTRNVGTIGVGYAPLFVSKRKDVNLALMVSERVEAVSRNTCLTPENINAIAYGNMQTFEGVNLPHLLMSEHIRAVDRPIIRITTGSTTGMSTLQAAYYHVASEMYDVALAVS